MSRPSCGAARRAFYRSLGLCPGCYVWYDGPRVFCFECRQEQSAKARAWYERNRAYALAAKWQRDNQRRAPHSIG